MWDLTISHHSPTWVKTTLEAEATRFLKKWVGLARSANPSSLYLPKARVGMNIPSVSVLHKKQQVSQASQLLLSHDPVVRLCTTKKFLREQQKTRLSFKPMVVARDTLATDPGMSRKKLSKVSQAMVVNEDAEERHSIMVATERRGEALHIAEEEAVTQWAMALDLLSPFELKFSLNACQDALPHNSNLALWKGQSAECKLCGERQTLHHILCNCPVALDLRRYMIRCSATSTAS